MPGSWGAGGGIGSGCRPCATTHHGGEACIERLLDLLRADVVDMRVAAASSDNLAFAGDRLGPRSDDDVDARLHVGIAGFAYAGHQPPPHSALPPPPPPATPNAPADDYRL